MTSYEPGDIVLVRFPFTDLAATKKRPALVLSPAKYADTLGDVVVLALTSQKQADDRLGMVNWRDSGLPKPSWFKPLIATIASSIIDRRLGVLSQHDHSGVLHAISLLIAPAFRCESQ